VHSTPGPVPVAMDRSLCGASGEPVPIDHARFFALSIDMLCIAGMDGYFKHLNAAFTDTLGYTEEELVTRPFLDFVHPDDRAATLAEMEALRAGVPTIRFENRYRCRDGSWRWLWWRVQPAVAEGRLYATARDVTRLRETQDALRASEALYRSLFESIDEGFCIIEIVVDADERPIDFRFQVINPSFEKHSGIAAVPGVCLRELVPDTGQHWIDTIGHVAATGEPLRFERWVPELQRWLNVYAFRFGDPAHRHVALVFSDVTARRTTDATVAQLNTDLRQRAAQLESANAELEAFCYSASHDLRAPLRHIDGYVEMLQQSVGETLPEKPRRYLQTIADASADMGRLIDDLLAFSRMTRTDMAVSPVALDDLVRDVVAAVAPPDGDHRVAWRTAPLPVVQGDRSLLKQVFTNLIDNAVKYSRTRPEARIEIGVADDDDGRAVVFVRDNGVGFDMGYAHKLFGVFQRLHRAEEFEGTGIGLAIVRRVVGRHGGRVWAESTVGQGTTFYVALPRPAADGARPGRMDR
jgi:PAS domain S-box-containing protein